MFTLYRLLLRRMCACQNSGTLWKRNMDVDPSIKDATFRKSATFFIETDDIIVGFISTQAIKIWVVKFIVFSLGWLCILLFSYFYAPSKWRKDVVREFSIGGFSYSKFRDVGFLSLYLTCLYFSTITIKTIGKFKTKLKYFAYLT